MTISDIDASRIAKIVNAAAAVPMDQDGVAAEIVAMYKTQMDAAYIMVCLMRHASNLMTQFLKWQAARDGDDPDSLGLFQPAIGLAGSANEANMLRVWCAMMNDDTDAACAWINVIVTQGKMSTCDALGTALGILNRVAALVMEAYSSAGDE